MFNVLAQADFDGFGNDPSAAEVIGALICYGVFFLICLAIGIAIMWFLSSALKALPENCQMMPPAHVWLMLIPLFNLVWIFFVYSRVSQSYRVYFNSVGRTEFGDCGEQIGLWYCICVVVSCIPCINLLTGPASLVLLILYIVKIAELKQQVRAMQYEQTQFHQQQPSDNPYGEA